MNVVLGISHLEKAAVMAETKDLGLESRIHAGEQRPLPILYIR